MKTLCTVLLAAAAFASGIGTVIAQHESRRLFVEIQDLEARRDDLNEEWGRLQLEQSAWSTYAYVERVADAKLHMRIPASREIETVGR